VTQPNIEVELYAILEFLYQTQSACCPKGGSVEIEGRDIPLIRSCEGPLLGLMFRVVRWAEAGLITLKIKRVFIRRLLF